MPAISSASQARLARFAGSFSRTIEAQLAEAEHEAQSRVRREATAQAQEARAQAKREAEEKRLLAARISLAHIGLHRLLAIGQSQPIQQMFRVLKRLKEDEICFFEAERYTGDAWFYWQKDDWERVQSVGGTCSVHLDFHQDQLYLSYGSDIPGSEWAGTTWEVFYNSPSPQEAAWQGGSDGRSEQGCSLADFLGEIAAVEPVNMSVVSRDNQRSLEWEPADVAFQLLVSCAKSRNLERYLSRCIKELKKTIRK